MEQPFFRKKAIEQISSPEQLSDYLKVTNPSIWLVLVAVMILLAGLIAWATIGTLETIVHENAIVKDGVAQIIIIEGNSAGIKEGMTFRMANQEEGVISYVEDDEYGRTIAVAKVTLPDGEYNVDIIKERVHPIQFLISNKR